VVSRRAPCAPARLAGRRIRPSRSMTFAPLRGHQDVIIAHYAKVGGAQRSARDSWHRLRSGGRRGREKAAPRRRRKIRRLCLRRRTSRRSSDSTQLNRGPQARPRRHGVRSTRSRNWMTRSLRSMPRHIRSSIRSIPSDMPLFRGRPRFASQPQSANSPKHMAGGLPACRACCADWRERFRGR